MICFHCFSHLYYVHHLQSTNCYVLFLLHYAMLDKFSVSGIQTALNPINQTKIDIFFHISTKLFQPSFHIRYACSIVH